MVDTACKEITLLDGRLTMMQARDYPIAIDSVLLASLVAGHYQRMVDDRQSDRLYPKNICELGVGTGGVMLCLLYHAQNLWNSASLDHQGYDCNGDFLALAQESLDKNNVQAQLHQCNIQDISKRSCFDALVMNPPYLPFNKQAGKPRSAMRSQALYEGDVPLAQWLDMAGKLLVSGGWLFLVHQASRLDEIISLVTQKFGDVTVYPIYSHQGKAAKRILLAAKYCSGGGFSLLSGLVMHEENGAYTEQADNILRGKDYV